MFKELDESQWGDELTTGLEYRRLYGKEDKWSEIEALAANAHNSLASTGPNIIYSMEDDLLSSLNTPNPSVLLEPTTEAEIETAPVMEAVDNQLIQLMKMKTEVEGATTAAYQWGTSFLKIGYDSEFGWAPEFDFNGPKEPMGLSLTQLDKRQRFIEFNEIEPGMPWIQACWPHDIVVPWGTRNIDTARWVAHRVIRHIDDVKADQKYTNTRNLQPNMSMGDFVKSYQSTIKPYRIGTSGIMTNLEIEGKAEFVELWEIHDKRTGKLFVVATGHDKFLRNERNALQICGLPFIELGFTPKTRNIWRTSDADYLLQAQAELSDISLQGGKQRRASVLKFLYDKNAISKQELDKLLSSDVGIAAGIDAQGKGLEQVIKTFQPGQNNNLYQESQFVRENARETSGFTRTQSGEYAGARTSAYEVSQVQGARAVRMTRRQTVIAETYATAFQKINAIIYKYWRTPRIVKMVGETGAETWMNYVGSQLKGKYSYKITFNDAPVTTDAAREQQAMMFYQLAAQDPTIDPIEARRWLARSFRDVRFNKIFKPGILDGSILAGQQGGASGGAAQTPPAQPGGIRNFG